MLLCLNYSNAQTIDATTGNLITNQWSGTTPINGAGGLSGGSTPGYVSSTDTIVFGYTTRTASQIQAVNQALSIAGTGIQINGLNYSWQYYNEGMNRGTLSGQINVANPSGQVLQSYTYAMPKNVDGTGWVSQSGTETFANPYTSSQIGYLGVAFTGKDDRYWAGYYGPMVRNVNVGIRYGVDPCATNPAYSPTCAGFSTVSTSGNLAPNPGYAYGGDSINNSFAINTALAFAGSAAQIHGFQWGYVANANGPYCAFWFFDCFDMRTPWVKTDVNITNSAGGLLFSQHKEYQNSYNTTNYSYLFPTSQQLSSLGNFYFTGSTNDQAYLGSMWTKALYTVDPCVNDPLFSPTCKGYAVAYAKNLLLGSTVSAASAPVVAAPTTPTSPPSATGSIGDVAQTTPTNTAPAGMQQTTQQGSTSPAPAPTADPNQNPSVAQMDPAQPTPTQPGPAPTSPQPAGGPPQVAQQSAPAPSSGPGPAAGPAKGDGPKMTTAQALSIIKTVQEKDKATQQLVVQNAAKVVEGSTQQSQATATSAIASLNDMSSNSATAAAAFASQTTQSSMQVAVTSTQQQQTQQGSQSSSFSMLSSGTGISISSGTFGLSTSSFANSFNNQSQVQSIAMYQPRVQLRQAEVEMPVVQLSSFGGSGRPGNTLSDMMMQQRFELMQSNIEQRGPSVNKNVQPNDLAVGVDVASMAVQPRGFELYSFMIKDSTFYPPKEVYRNQKVVDNVMVLRQMSSDKLHQDMVDSQYKER